MIINALNNLVDSKKSTSYVFLGGPIQGAPDWQNKLPDIPGITWISPRRLENIKSLSEYEWENQVSWETNGIRVSDVLLFWVPLNIEEIPGRDYAQTTRMELLENLSRGKKIIIGIEDGVHAKRYMSYKSLFYGVSRINNSLEECISELMDYLKNRSENNKIFFTSDTHFNSERALELSRRPFRNVVDMNMSMIENWNKIVPPEATVYHLGDFGDRSYAKFLNGNINLILGNYEVDEFNNLKKEKNLDLIDFTYQLQNEGFSKIKFSHDVIESKKYGDILLVHEPSKSLDIKEYNKYYLFGHIHEKQKIKDNGVNVSVDCNNFTPMSIDDVDFYLNALDKKYYDKEVFL